MATKPRKRKPNKGIPIFRHDGAAVVGRVEGDVFRKSAASTVHLLTRPRAWSCDVDALDQAKEAGAAWIEITDRDTGLSYRAALADFYRRGVAVNRGHGSQLALPLIYWTVKKGPAASRPGQDAAAPAVNQEGGQAAAGQDAAANSPSQLTLFRAGERG